MSIAQTIQKRVSEHELYALAILPKGAERLRKMFITADLHQAISNPQPHEVAMFARLESDLAVFVTSPSIDMGYLKLLKPLRNAVWEIKSPRPSPGLRVLGLFADRNVFIAMQHYRRVDLGKFGSREWRNAIELARASWRKLFPTGEQPRFETDATQLVKGAISGQYFQN